VQAVPGFVYPNGSSAGQLQGKAIILLSFFFTDFMRNRDGLRFEEFSKLYTCLMVKQIFVLNIPVFFSCYNPN
jgi:hypothetical protein